MYNKYIRSSLLSFFYQFTTWLLHRKSLIFFRGSDSENRDEINQFCFKLIKIFLLHQLLYRQLSSLEISNKMMMQRTEVQNNNYRFIISKMK